uniref:Putative FtsN cell division protein n=1 Tax=mine drainage metagenome TaxID=410659 RepID=E6QSR1_9ZZZZ
MAQSRNSPLRADSAHKSGGIWSGILIGVLIGLAGAAAVAVWVGRSNPFTEHNTATSNATVSAQAPSSDAQVVDPVSHALPAQSGQHYDFYKILPGNDASGTHPDNAPPSTTAPGQVADSNTKTSWLQAGTFADPQKADDMKAQLALMGLESSIQTLDLPGKGSEYRVRLGPFGTTELATVQANLAQNHIDTKVMKTEASTTPPNH